MIKDSKAGKYIRLLRLMNNLQQSDIARYLQTTQAIFSQIEQNRYKINQAYAHQLNKLFSLNPEFLVKLVPPVFLDKVALFTIRTSDMPAMKFRNQIDDAIRTILPSLCKIEKISDIFAWHSGELFDYSRKFSASLLILYSSECGHMIVIRILEDSKKQFFNAFTNASDKLSIDFDIHPIEYGEFEKFLADDIPHYDDEDGEQFKEILSLTDIQGQEEYLTAYLKLLPNELFLDKASQKIKQKDEEYDKKRIDAIEGVVRTMNNYGIDIKEIADNLRKTT